MNEAESYLKDNGYKFQYDNGVLMIQVEKADGGTFMKIRSMMHKIGYNKSFGIKQIANILL